MSVLTAADVEARMSTGLAPEVLESVIADEEAWAADHPRLGLGPLVGARTQRMWVSPGDDRPLLLQRPTDEQGGLGSGGRLVVVDGDVELADDEVALTGPARIEKITGPWRGPTVDVTYAPIDEPTIRRGLFDLIQITLTMSPYRTEQSEGHGYERPAKVEEMREDVLRRLSPHHGLMSTRLVTGSGRITSRP